MFFRLAILFCWPEARERNYEKCKKLVFSFGKKPKFTCRVSFAIQDLPSTGCWHRQSWFEQVELQSIQDDAFWIWGGQGGHWSPPPLIPSIYAVIEKRKRNRNRHTFVVYFERLERFKNIKNKSLQSCLSIVDFIDGIRASGTGGSRGAHYPPHPLNLDSYIKEKQKQE